MRISILIIFSIFIILPIYGQQIDGTESLQGDNLKNDVGELDTKNEELSNDNETKEKPRKLTFKDERFEKLFNNRLRKARLPTPKHHAKVKAQLPSFIKKPPVIKPLGQDGLPVDDEAPRPTPISSSSRSRTQAKSNTSKVTTSTLPPRSRARITSTTTTTPKPSLSDSNRRFNNSARNRISSSNPSSSLSSRGRSN